MHRTSSSADSKEDRTLNIDRF